MPVDVSRSMRESPGASNVLPGYRREVTPSAPDPTCFTQAPRRPWSGGSAGSSWPPQRIRIRSRTFTASRRVAFRVTTAESTNHSEDPDSAGSGFCPWASILYCVDEPRAGAVTVNGTLLSGIYRERCRIAKGCDARLTAGAV